MGSSQSFRCPELLFRDQIPWQSPERLQPGASQGPPFCPLPSGSGAAGGATGPQAAHGRVVVVEMPLASSRAGRLPCSSSARKLPLLASTEGALGDAGRALGGQPTRAEEGLLPRGEGDKALCPSSLAFFPRRDRDLQELRGPSKDHHQGFQSGGLQERTAPDGHVGQDSDGHSLGRGRK